MNKRGDKRNIPHLPLTVWVFLLFLAAMSVWTLLCPDRAFSPAENRVLAQFPAFSFRKLMDRNNNWTSAFETYVTDQFAMRDGWVAIKASAERLVGKKENDGVYLAKGALMEKPAGYSDATRALNLRSIQTFAQAVEAETYLALVPNACCIDAARLPRFADDGVQRDIIRDCYADLEGVQPIDLLSALTAREGEPLYYRTDHHPTSLGAYRIYQAICGETGLTPHALSAYETETVSTDFSGTARAKSGAWWIQKDSIELFRLKGAADSVLITHEGDTSTQTDGLYAFERLNTADQYTVFLGGNHPRQVVKTEGTGGGRLLMIKDSFAHCVVPFLAAHYAEIHLLDLRYYRVNVQDYARENGIDQIIILYSVGNFMTDRNLLFLNMAQ